MLKSISGFEDEEGIHLQNNQYLEHEFIETTGLNPLELACARGSADILTYFIKDLNLRTRSDFCANQKDKKISDLPFIFAPLINKDHLVFKHLLNLDFWTYNELLEILSFTKQVKWTEGIQIFFKSTSLRNVYHRLSLGDRYQFVQECLELPFRTEKIPVQAESENDDEQMDMEVRYENNLDEAEARTLYLVIKDALCEDPFALTMLLVSNMQSSAVVDPQYR